MSNKERKEWKVWDIETCAISTAAQERCIKQHALTAGRNVNFPSDPQKAAPSTAANVTQSVDHQNISKLSRVVR